MSNVQAYDLYEVLGVKPSAPAREIELAYRRLVQKYNAQRDNPQGLFPRERLGLIRKAYDILSDRDKRQAYHSKVAARARAFVEPFDAPVQTLDDREPFAPPQSAAQNQRRQNIYRDFFGFSEKPFDLTPDPKYLYLSPKHKEVLAHLVYGMQENNGFLKIVGEVGTGKTTICRSFLRGLQENFNIAYIFNPWVTAIELLQSINKEFGLPFESASKKQLVDILNEFLLIEKKRGNPVVVIIDEAQDLDPTVLEQLRLISNLETETEKLIQIVLIGQPELDDLLAREDMRQLRQRVAIQWELLPLNQDETRGYLQHRINVALGKGKVHFTSGAVRAIYLYTKGIPRTINILADRSLLIAYTKNTKRIGPGIIHQASKEVGGFKRTPFYKNMLLKAGVPALALTLLVAGYQYIFSDGADRQPESLPQASARVAPDTARTVEATVGLERPVATASLETPTTNGAPETFENSVAIEPPLTAAIPAQAPVETFSEPEQAMEEEVAGGALAFNQTETLVSYLSSLTLEESKLEASKWIFQEWGVQPVDLMGLDASIFRQVKEEYGLSAYELHGDLERLARFNYPAILELALPDSRGTKYLTLVSIDGDRGTFGSSDLIEMPLSVVNRLWNRKALIFWKDFEDLPADFQRGYRGRLAVWLQKNLRLLGFFQGREAPVYGGKTTRAVSHFQRRYGIPDDGKFGLQSRLMLYNLLDIYNTPSLKKP